MKKVINGYEVAQTLTSKNGKQIYLVRGKDSREIRILKIIDLQQCEGSEKGKMLKHARIGMSIKYRHLVHVFDCFFLQDQPNLFGCVEEYAPLGSLKRLLLNLRKESTFMDYFEAWSIIVQVARGYRFLHANDILHCQVKTSNIMLFKNGIVKIRNFGCSISNNRNVSQSLRSCIQSYIL